MHVIEATDNLKEEWDRFVVASPTGSFLQSWVWGEVQRAAGLPITRLAVTADNGQLTANRSLVAVCLLVHRPLPFGRSYLSAPWGPVFRSPEECVATAPGGSTSALAALTEELRTRLRQGAVFVRMEPRLFASAAWQPAFSAHGYVPSPRNIQPKDTLVIDLTRSEDDLRRAMHPKTRYNIRVAQRRGVTVREQTDANGLAAFLALAREVERHGKFHYHPPHYYEAMLNVLAPAGMLHILLAEHEGWCLAAHLLIRFGRTMTYAHGASSRQRLSVMAPHLLQWEGIVRAKAAGASRYDLFGIAPRGASLAHPWFGITRFKRGFGGAEEHYLGALDLVGDPALYRLYEIGRGLRALFRS